MHYPIIEDIELFLGNRDAGAYSKISAVYYNVLPQYLPKAIEDNFGEQIDPFNNPTYPYYYKVKNDEKIDAQRILLREFVHMRKILTATTRT